MNAPTLANERLAAAASAMLEEHERNLNSLAALRASVGESNPLAKSLIDVMILGARSVIAKARGGK